MKNKLLLFIAAVCLANHVFAQTTITANPYYSTTVTAVGNDKGIPVQAFVAGHLGDTLLILGGRTVGLHNFNAPSFPENTNNHYIYVFVPNSSGGTIYKLHIPLTLSLEQQRQISSTNMEYCQSDSVLFCVGGYGADGKLLGNRNRTITDKYRTFNNCFAVNVPAMINAVISNNSKAAANSITFATQPPLTDTTLAVCGGELVKMGQYYYLNIGQRFTGEYGNNSFQQTYNCKIIQLQFNYTPGSLTYSAISSFTDGANLHRRDLNVVPVITSASGTQGIDIYGGVFTPTANGGPYLNPVHITSGAGGAIQENVNSMVQCFNQYTAAHFLIYDSVSNTMQTTILGGITMFDSVSQVNNNQPPPNAGTPGDTSMPWGHIISTIVRNNSEGTYTEYASDNDTLPGLIGGEAKFIPYSQFLRAGSDEIMDYQKILQAAHGTGSVTVGYMIGGIVSSLPNTTKFSQTKSNPTLYSVTLNVTGMQGKKNKGRK